MIVAPPRARDLFAKSLFLASFVALGGVAIVLLASILFQAPFDLSLKWFLELFGGSAVFFIGLSYYYLNRKHKRMLVLGVPGLKIVDNTIYCEKDCTVEIGVVGIEVETTWGGGTKQVVVFKPKKQFKVNEGRGFKLLQGAEDYIETYDVGDKQIIAAQLPAARVTLGTDKYLLVLADFRGKVTESKVVVMNQGGENVIVRCGESTNSLFFTVRSTSQESQVELVLKNPLTGVEWTIARLRGKGSKELKVDYPVYPEVIVIYQSLLYTPRIDWALNEVLGDLGLLKLGELELIVKKRGTDGKVEQSNVSVRYVPEFAEEIKKDLDKGVALIRERLL